MAFAQTDNDGDMDIRLRFTQTDFDYSGSNEIGEEEHKIKLEARANVDVDGIGWTNPIGFVAHNADGEVTFDHADITGHSNVYGSTVPTRMQMRYEYWEEDCYNCSGGFICFGSCGSADQDVNNYNANCGCACDCLITGGDDNRYFANFETDIRSFPPGWTDRGWFDGDGTANSDRPRIRADIYWTPPRPDELILSESEVCDGTLVILASAGAEWNGTYVWEYRNTSTANSWTVFGTDNDIQVFVVNETTDFRVRTQNGTLISLSDRQATVTVKTESVEPASISASDFFTCPGNLVTLTAVGGTAGTGAELHWFEDFCGGPPVGIGNSITVSQTQTTTYYARYEDDCTTETPCTSVTINVIPTPAPVASDQTACVGETITLEAFGGGGSFNWFDQNNMATSPTITPTMAGTYIYSVQEVNGGCTSQSAFISVLVTEKPTAPSSGPVTVCEGENVELMATAAGTGTLNYYDNTGTQVSPTIGLLAAGSYTYSVTEDNGACESDPTSISVTVTSNPEMPLANDIVACEGEDIILSATSLAGGALSWFDNMGNPTGTNQGMLAAGTYTYTVREDNGSCQGPANIVTVTVSTVPMAPTASNVAVCVGENVMLAATASGSGSLNYYDADGTQVSSNQGILAAGTYTYTVTEDNGACESMATTITVTVSDTPVPPLAADIEVCEGEMVNLVASTSTGGTLEWLDNLGNPTTDAQGMLAAGDYTFSVTEVNGGCASAPSFVSVTVAPTPAMPMLMPINICQGTSTEIFAGAGTFNWYEDATGGTAIFSGPSYTTPVLVSSEDYYVSEVIGDCEGPRGQVDVIVSPDLPTPNITSNSPVCEGSAIQLTTDFNADYDYSWSGPNGWSSSMQNPQITNAVANLNSGTYQLVVEDVNTGCTATNSVVVTVTPNPTSVPLFTNSPVCEGDDLVLSTAAISGASYTWSGPSGILGTTTDPTYTVVGASAADAGTYTLVVGISGCSSSATSAQVVVQASPATPLASNNGPVCEGESITLGTSAIPGASYTWSGPNGIVGTQAVVTLDNVNATDAGTYTVVVAENGCESAAGSTNVVIDASPVINGMITNNGPLCEGETLQIDAPAAAGVDYMWTGPNGLPVDAVEDPSFSNVTEGDHQGLYTLVMIDQATGCSSDPMTTYVQIDASPTGINAGNSGVACVGGSVNLTATGIFGATYNWTGPNGFSSTDQNPVLNNVSLADAGTYFVEVTVGDCISAALETVVSINEGPTVVAMDDIEVLQGETAQLLATGAISYNWTPTDYLSNPSTANPIFGPAPAGVYTYTVTGYDANLCSGTDEMNVTVIPNENLEIVDLITPNGDGVNETWVVTYLENLKDGYTIRMYARGGIQIFETDNYNNDWDGTLDGEALPDGTYWYVIKAVNGPTFKGAVTIKR